ncbi:MAG TPA: polysaccharide biosynthesis protein [Acholeplasmataceae bacterium]|nr:polysaccharide biosynthesis protein [Acholeplasmataceae bacterium]
MKINKNRIFNYLFYVTMDALLIAISYMFSLFFLELINYNFTYKKLPHAIFLIIIFKILIFSVTGIYKMMVAFLDFRAITRIVLVSIATNFLIVFVMLFSFTPEFLPRTMYLFITPIEIIMLVCFRLIRPLIRYLELKREQQKLLRKRTLIIGAGSTGSLVLKELDHNKDFNNYVIGFLDDDLKKIGQTISSKEVLGTIDDLDEVIKNNQVDEVIIAIKDYNKTKLNELYNKINSYDNINIKKINLFESQQSRVNIVNINLEDLLNREEINLDNQGILELIKDEVILVTGGGGSIGSELCRQIFKLKPKQLIIFDIYENNAYDIEMELKRIKYKNANVNTDIKVLIGSVYNEQRLDEVFNEYRPNVVFHAAAYKHVPLMEESPREAIRTNVIGTNNVAKLSNQYEVKKMVLVSSDKAVRSTNVMGATKRFAELIIDYYNKAGKTIFSSVRFGNVLGSNGSVIPLFKKQIEDGGPITVTHREITRYFMTIPEAVGLILQCAVYAKGGETFILDMGEPVKVYDLAIKMIKLTGYKPFIDIGIDIIGLRPGEKLYEELLVNPNDNNIIETNHSRIFIEKNNSFPYDHNNFEYVNNNFEKAKNEDIRIMLSKIIKTYKVEGETNGNT